MEIRPIRDIFRVNSPDRKPAIIRGTIASRRSQDTYDQSDASGHRRKRRGEQQDTIEISQAYQDAREAYNQNPEQK